jgi:uncharacterized membrane protein
MSKAFFSRLDEPKIIDSIRAAERRSRGEIRIHVTEALVEDPLPAAAAAFERLGMTATVERNGILIFVAPRSQKFAVIGDSGITSIVGTGPLDEIASAASKAFRESRFTDGLVVAVEKAGDLLAAHFPPRQGAADKDELPDSISRG